MEQTGVDDNNEANDNVDGDNDDDVDEGNHDVVKVSVQYLRPPWTSEFPLYHECHTPTEIQVLTSSTPLSSSELSFLPLALSLP